MIEDSRAIRDDVEAVLKEVVRPAVHPVAVPLDVTAHHLHGEPVPYAEATADPAAFEPFAVGDPWGAPWDTTWFRLRGVVPAEWAERPGHDVVARIELSDGGDPGFTAEGMVYADGLPVQGLHPRHRWVRVTPVSGADSADGTVELYVEAAANPVAPFHTKDWPLLAAEYDGGPLYRLARAELAVLDTEVEALAVDLFVLLRLYDATEQQPRRNQLLATLAEAVRAVDRADVAGSAAAARQVLAPALARRTHVDHRVTAVGHAHIDTAWLWPLRETRRKVARTSANQLRLMDEFPEHRFACSQAQQYAWLRDDHPHLWEQVKARVASGEWEPVGGMWVEPDTNVPSGESLVRQVVHGKRFFLDELGVESAELWIPDVFGYSAALPQIARQAGITALITQKLSWNRTNRFPHSTFVWEGHDGSRIVTHFPPSDTYNGVFTPDELAASLTNYIDHGRLDRSLYPFGHGDGGGGPTRRMLEQARRVGDLEGLPRVELGTVASFLDDAVAAADAGRLDTWVGELYFEFHRGTYTTHADVKTGNRRGEEALRAAELWSAAAACLGAAGAGDYPSAPLDEAWKLLLLHQFHDILPGSSIHWVYEDTRRDLARVASLAGDAIAAAQSALVGSGDSADSAGGSSTVFNAAGHDRREVVTLPSGELGAVAVPACGWAPAESVDLGDRVVVDAAARRMENGLLRVEWDADGLLTSVFDLEAGREVLAEGDGVRGNLLQLHEDHPAHWDAWDVDESYLDKVVDLVDAASVEVVTDDPLRAELAVERRFGGSAGEGPSTIRQVVRLDAGSRHLEVHNEVDWRERHRFLKVAFPVAIRSSRATYEIQHGTIERPTVRNTSWDAAQFEVSAHRWAHLGETGYGVALLNDSKYGYDVRGNVLRLSLLRASAWPDPQADRGAHRFAYALLPHSGTILEGRVAASAEAFNLPLQVVPGRAAASSSFVSVDRPGVSIEAVKRADDGDDLVVRLCEVSGSRGPVTVTLAVPLASAVRTDLLERPLPDAAPVDVADGAVTLSLRPHELVTLRLGLA